MTSHESLTLSTSRPESGVVVLAAAGELDMLTAPRLEAALNEILDAEPRVVVVDLSKVDFLGSAGLAVLVSAHERGSSREKLRIVVSARDTRRVFSLTGLDKALALYPTLEAALADA